MKLSDFYKALIIMIVTTFNANALSAVDKEEYINRFCNNSKDEQQCRPSMSVMYDYCISSIYLSASKYKNFENNIILVPFAENISKRCIESVATARVLNSDQYEAYSYDFIDRNSVHNALYNSYVEGLSKCDGNFNCMMDINLTLRSCGSLSFQSDLSNGDIDILGEVWSFADSISECFEKK